MMKLRLDTNGNAVLENGKPVYIFPDGREEAFDALMAVNQIKDLSGDLDKWRTKAQETGKALEATEAKVNKLSVGEAFTRSRFIAEKAALPMDMLEAYFGPRFSIDEGRVIAKYPDGSRVMSREHPGETAGFDEALSILIGQHPQSNAMLKNGDSGQQSFFAGGKSPVTGKSPSQMTFAEKSAFIDTNGVDKWAELVMSESLK